MKKVLITILIIVLVLALIAGAAYAFLINKLNKVNYVASAGEGISENNAGTPAETALPEAQTEPEVSTEPEAEEQTSFKADEDVVNILLVGDDNVGNVNISARGNADGILLLSINKRSEKIVASSILRSIEVELRPGVHYMPTLIYHDYGIEKLIECLENNLQIKIDNYVMVNYLNVINVIEAVGGVDVEIKSSELHEFSWKMDEVNKLVGDAPGTDVLTSADVGPKHLNGKQATVYMRLRLGGGDEFARTQRIRTVISLLKEKVLGMNLLEMNKLSDVVLENINTDMTTKDMLSLIKTAPKFAKYELKMHRVPVDGTYTLGPSYVYIDMEENVKALHEAIYG